MLAVMLLCPVEVALKVAVELFVLAVLQSVLKRIVVEELLLERAQRCQALQAIWRSPLDLHRNMLGAL